MYHPSRGGVRGGRDQFNWDDVKGDKHRENYLGHSLKAPVGRWQKGKDLHWYTRDKHSEGAAAREEIKRIQEEEHYAMQEMLGLAPKKVNREQGNQLDEREVTEILKKVKDGDKSAPSYAAGERVQGLGFAPAPGQIAPGQTGAKRTGSNGYEKDSALLTSDQRSLEFSRNVGEENVRQDSLVIVEAPAPIIAGSEDERNASSSDEEHAVCRKRKEERRRAKEQQREMKRARKQACKEGKLKRSKSKVQSDSYWEETDEDKHIRKHGGAEWEGTRGYAGRSFSHINGQSRKGDLPNKRSYKKFNARHDSDESPGRGQETHRKSNTHANELLRRDSRSHHGSDGKGKVKHDGNKEVEERRGQAGKRSPTGINVHLSRYSPYKEKSAGSGKVRYDSEDSETSEQPGGRRAFSSSKAHTRRHLSYKGMGEDKAQVRHDTEEWKERKGGTSWNPSQNGVPSGRNSSIKKRIEGRGMFRQDSEDSEGSRGDAWRKGSSHTNVHSKVNSPYKQRREDIVHGWHYTEDWKREASPGNNLHPRSSLYDKKNEGKGKFSYDSADREDGRQDTGRHSSIHSNVHTRRDFPYQERSDGKELHKSEERNEGRRRMQLPQNMYSQSSYLGVQNGHARNDEQGTLLEYLG